MDQHNPFLYSNSEKRYHTWNYHLREHFGHKVFKVALDGGFDCPNRDGTVAHGGCTFFVPLDLVILQETGLMISSLNLTKSKTGCIQNGKTENTWRISRRIQTHTRRFLS